jgi:hypothetical protein
MEGPMGKQVKEFFEPDQVAEQGLFRPDFLQELAQPFE